MPGDIRNLALVAVAGLAFGGLMYIRGQSNGEQAGAARAQLRASEIERARLEATRALQGRIDDLAKRQAAIESQRQTATREIHRETERIVETPVYRTVCVDADGVRLLDQAAAVANGDLSERGPAADDPAAAGAERAPDGGVHMTGADCLRSMVDLYDYAGRTRAQLIDLQAQVTAAGSQP